MDNIGAPARTGEAGILCCQEKRREGALAVSSHLLVQFARGTRAKAWNKAVKTTLTIAIQVAKAKESFPMKRPKVAKVAKARTRASPAMMAREKEGKERMEKKGRERKERKESGLKATGSVVNGRLETKPLRQA